MKERVLPILSVVAIFTISFITVIKTIKYEKTNKIDHSYFREKETNSVITDVAISRKVEVKKMELTIG